MDAHDGGSGSSEHTAINAALGKGRVNVPMDWECADHPRVPDVPMPMQQHPAYALACGALGRRMRWFCLGPRTAPTATALVLCRHWPGLGNVALMSRGPVWADELTPDTRKVALLALVARLRRDHAAVIVTPDPVAGRDPLDRTSILPLVTPMTVAMLDLTSDTAARRVRLRGKWRNALVRAEASPLHITASRMPAQPDHWLLRQEAAQARKRGYRGLPPAFAVAWARMSADDTLLMAAHDDTGPVAGMLFLRHGAAASYHTGWTCTSGRAAGAHTRLLWEGSERLAAAGVTLLDLGLIDTHHAAGIARFKLGTGAAPTSLGATRIAAPGTALVAGLFRTVSGPATRYEQQATGIIR